MSSSYSPCAACKCLRRKCTQECELAPYFPPDDPQRFSNVHKVFGASNVSKILNELNVGQREEAANSLAYEADCRLKDPVYGCVGFISLLHHRLKQIHLDLENAKKELAAYIGPSATLPVQHYQMMQQQQQFLEAQHLAAATQQEIMQLQQQQNGLLKFNGGFDDAIPYHQIQQQEQSHLHHFHLQQQQQQQQDLLLQQSDTTNHQASLLRVKSEEEERSIVPSCF